MQYEIDPGYDYEFDEDGNLITRVPPPPPDFGEIMGRDDKILYRKPGASEFLTTKGNVPAADYELTGGYYGKPGDPHNDPRNDVIYYPNEIHTRKEDGGWDIAARPKPPGEKPSDAQLSALDFMKWVQADIDKEANEYGFSARLRWENSISRSTQALMHPGQFEWEAVKVEKEATDKHRTHLTNMYWNEALKQEQAAMKRRETPSDTSLTIQALRENLGREPSAKEILDAKEASAVKIAGAKAEAQTKAKEGEGFKTWTPEAKEQTFMENVITGKPPVNAQGLGGNDRKQYGKEFAQWKVDKSIKPQDVALMQADYRAGDATLKNMSKQEAPMSAFVLNINKQVNKLEELFSEAQRSGLRIIDLPVRELRVRAKGSGKEAVLASYLLEVSNEIGKLSSGSSASIQQLSDSAKEDWKKVHDVNLSPKEILYVLNATKDQANMRMDTWRQAKEEVRSMIGFMGARGEERRSGAESVGLKIGDTKKGYRYKGGNPADKSSWEKI